MLPFSGDGQNEIIYHHIPYILFILIFYALIQLLAFFCVRRLVSSITLSQELLNLFLVWRRDRCCFVIISIAGGQVELQSWAEVGAKLEILQEESKIVEDC